MNICFKNKTFNFTNLQDNFQFTPKVYSLLLAKESIPREKIR